MYLAVIALNLAVFGLVVLSQRIWRFQFISATATAAVWASRTAVVVGPTPPGTGVISRARWAAAAYSTSVGRPPPGPDVNAGAMLSAATATPVGPRLHGWPPGMRPAAIR